jgi:hypothetical protein
MSSSEQSGAAADSPLSKRLIEWLDIAVKLTAPAAVILVAVLGHSLQGSLTTSQMLTQREQSDTTIRAEMFKSISDRLFGAKTGTPLSPGEKAVFTELLALNFHEHIELKPLLLEVDQGLLAEARRRPAARGQVEAKRKELHSVARRVRQRQTAALLQIDQAMAMPAALHAGIGAVPLPVSAASTAPAAAGGGAESAGRLQVLSVRLRGYLPGVRGAVRSACDVPRHEGPSVCLREPIFQVSPDGRTLLSVTVEGANNDRQSVQLSVKHSPLRSAGDAPPTPGDYPSDAPMCGSELGDSDRRASVATTGSAAVQFDATWFDFPLTDNTLLANGARYAVFIEDLCLDEPGGQQTVKLGLLWFPKDYFPARERPTNFRQLRRKLGLDLEG